jgi:hypothetical protein
MTEVATEQLSRSKEPAGERRHPQRERNMEAKPASDSRETALKEKESRFRGTLSVNRETLQQAGQNRVDQVQEIRDRRSERIAIQQMHDCAKQVAQELPRSGVSRDVQNNLVGLYY